MSVYLTPMPQPVEQAYSGGDAVNVRRLTEFCNGTSANFARLVTALDQTNARLHDTLHTNKQLIQFMNWLAVTNPQILDEFQATANAFEKLSPRDHGAEGSAVAGY